MTKPRRAPPTVRNITQGVRRMKPDPRPTNPAAFREIANSPDVQDYMRSIAKDIQRDARRLAPRETGILRRGIVIEEYTDPRTGIEGFAVGWSDRAFYGWLVETGSEDQPPRPHLIPAAIKNGMTPDVRGDAG